MKVLNIFETDSKKLEQAKTLLERNGFKVAVEELQQLAKMNQVVYEKQLEFQICQLEQQIAELEDVYRSVSKARGFVAIEIPTFSTTLVDEMLAEQTGYSVDEWCSTPNFISTIIHPDFEDYFSERSAELLRGIIPKYMEYKVKYKDGQDHWWFQCNVGSFDINGKLTSLSAFIFDQTEKKIAEIRLKESETKFRSLVEQSIAGILVIKNNQIVFSNDIIFRQSGFTREQIDHLDFNILCQFLHPDDIEFVKQQYFTALKNGFTPEFYCRIISPSNQTIWLSTQFNKMAFEGEEAIAAIMVEVTKRAQLEQKLLQERDLAKKFFDITRSMLVILDTNGTILEINNRACEILKCSKEEAIGLNWIETFIPREFRSQITQLFQSTVNDQVDQTESFVNYVLAQDGSQPLISWRNITFHNDKGEVTSVISSGEDISDHIDAKQKFLARSGSK